MTALYLLAALIAIPVGCVLILGYIAGMSVCLGMLNDAFERHEP